MFQGRVAVVMGAASGIGCSTALLLAERGARVALGDKDAEGLSRVAGSIRERGAAVCEARVDVMHLGEVERFRALVEAQLGAPDLVVNAAGVVVVGSFEATSPGHVVNVASAASFFTPRELIAYGATKHGRSSDPEAERRRLKALLARRGLGAERVAAAIVRAAERGSGVVPVGAEAWVLHALERLSPGASARLVGLVRRLVDRTR